VVLQALVISKCRLAMGECLFSRHLRNWSAIFPCGEAQVRTQQVPVARRYLSLRRTQQRPGHLQVRLTVQNCAQGSPRRQNQRRRGSPYHVALDTVREVDCQRRHERLQNLSTNRFNYALNPRVQSPNLTKSLSAPPHTPTHIFENLHGLLCGVQILP
jgi:hypothetical protein